MRFLRWPDRNLDKGVGEYSMVIHPFAAKSSSFIFALHRTAIGYGSEYLPEAQKTTFRLFLLMAV